MISREFSPVEQQCLDTGIPCDSFALAENGVCPYLERGKQIVEDRLLLEEASYDELLDGYYTTLGVKRLIASDPELAQQFVEGRIGLAIVDLRGVKGANVLHSYAGGNRLIATGAKRLPGIRLVPDIEPREPERRAEPATKPDISMRGQGQKSDELVILMRGVHSSKDMNHILNERILPIFSVDQAIVDSAAGRIPVVANGVASHASDYAPTSDFKGNKIWAATSIFERMVSETLEKLNDGHDDQYDQMWASVLQRRELTSKGMSIEKPADERQIVTIFWEVCCPDFMNNIEAMLGSSALSAARGDLYVHVPVE